MLPSLTALLAALLTSHGYANEDKTAEQQALDACLLKALETADNEVTVGELRERCQQQQVLPNPSFYSANTAPGRRIAQEFAAGDNRFALIAHRPTYFLPGVYNDSIERSFSAREGELDNVESQFQVSFKIPLYRGVFCEIPVLKKVFGENDNLSFAYTNRSFWQVYNSELSAAFRETNHEPEVILSFFNDWQWGELRNVAFSLKPWYRLPEALKTDSLDTTGDDNPDITDFMGHFEWQGVYDYDGQSFSLMICDPITARGAYE